MFIPGPPTTKQTQNKSFIGKLSVQGIKDMKILKFIYLYLDIIRLAPSGYGCVSGLGRKNDVTHLSI